MGFFFLHLLHIADLFGMEFYLLFYFCFLLLLVQICEVTENTGMYSLNRYLFNEGSWRVICNLIAENRRAVRQAFDFPAPVSVVMCESGEEWSRAHKYF